MCELFVNASSDYSDYQLVAGFASPCDTLGGNSIIDELMNYRKNKFGLFTGQHLVCMLSDRPQEPVNMFKRPVCNISVDVLHLVVFCQA